MGVFKEMDIRHLEALERIAAALEAIAAANGCRIEAATVAAAEAVAEAVPEAPAPAPAAKAEQAAPAPAPAAEPVDLEAMRREMVEAVKAYCLADLAANKPKVGEIFARYGVTRVGATPLEKVPEIVGVLKSELGI